MGVDNRTLSHLRMGGGGARRDRWEGRPHSIAKTHVHEMRLLSKSLCQLLTHTTTAVVINYSERYMHALMLGSIVLPLLSRLRHTSAQAQD